MAYSRLHCTQSGEPQTLCDALMTSATMTSSSATSERSFSVLRRLKEHNKARSVDQLYNSSRPQDIHWKIDLNAITKTFASEKRTKRAFWSFQLTLRWFGQNTTGSDSAWVLTHPPPPPDADVRNNWCERKKKAFQFQPPTFYFSLPRLLQRKSGKETVKRL